VDAPSSAPAGGDPSLLTLGLTAALGAAGAVIWNQSRSADPTESAATPSASATDEPEAAGVHGTGQETAEGDASGPTATSDAESDNPLDRLESRP